jgi:very-short-patch-repair endonuclease
VLRRLLDARDGMSVLPNSPLESRFFELLSSSNLPSPELQHVVVDRGAFVARLDFAWPDVRFAVEMDGYSFHSDIRSFARDRERGNDLTLLGWKVVRGTWDDAENDPEGLMLRVERGYRSCSPEFAALVAP